MMKRLLTLLIINLILSFSIHASPFIVNTPEINLSEPALIELAQRLDNDPVKIYNWVYNNIKYKQYQGARKDALSTYWTKEGNSWDQSTLLIALYRIASIPARYVYPNLVSSPSEVNNENIFIEASLTLNEARGFGGDKKRWIQLAPWVKYSQYLALNEINYFDSSGQFVYADAINFDLNNDYLSELRTETAWEFYQKKLSKYLASQGKSFKGNTITTKYFNRSGDVLPLSLPLALSVPNYLGAGSHIPTAFKLRITIYLDEVNTNGSIGQNLLTHDVYLSEIASKRVAVDFTTIESYNGLISDANNLITAPVLKIDGAWIRIGANTNSNKRYRYGYQVEGQDRQNRLTRPVGSFEVLTFDLLNTSHEYLARLKAELNDIPISDLADWRTREAYLGRYLQILSSQFLLRFKDTLDEMSNLLNVNYALIKQSIFSVNMYTDFLASDLDYLSDNNSQEKYLIHPAVNIDNQNVAINFSNNYGGNLPFRNFILEVAMYSASYQEGKIFEDWQSTTAGSTIHALMHAEIDPNNSINISNSGGVLRVEPNSIVSYDGLTITAAHIELSDNSLGFLYSSDNNGNNNGGSANNDNSNVNNHQQTEQASNDYYYDWVDEDDYDDWVDEYVGDSDDNTFYTYDDDNYAADTWAEGDPVDLLSGEFYQQEKADLVFKSVPGVDFAIKRTYRSQSTYNSIFGYGWTWNHMERLFLNSDTEIIYFSNGGRATQITRSGNTYQLAPGITFELTQVGDNYVITEKDGSQKIFNNLGLLIHKISPYGASLTFNYNSDYRLSSINDYLNRTFTFNYNSNDKVTSITDSLGRIANYIYYQDGDDKGTADDLKSFTNLDNQTTRYEYIVSSDNGLNNHNMSKYILPSSDNDYLTIAYYKNDQVSHHTNSKGEIFNFQYSAKNKYAEIWDEANYYKKVFYNDNGDVIRIDTRDSTVEIMTYDDDHNVRSKTDGNGNTTNYTYDDNRNRLSQVDALGVTTTYAYTNRDYQGNDMGVDKVATITLVNGLVISNTYYDNSLLRNTTEPNGNITQYSYDGYGNLLSRTNNNLADSDYQTLNHTYSNSGINRLSTTANNQTTAYTYDNYDNQVAITNPNAAVTTYQYNAFNQVTQKTDALSNQTSYQYNANNQLMHTTHPNRAVFETIYDTARDIVTKGLVLQQIDPYGNAKTYTYDKVGNKTSETNANGNTTSYQYDGLGRIMKMTNAGGHSTYYQYDGAGNKIKQHFDYYHDTSLVNVTTYYFYDANNRLTQKHTVNTAFSANQNKTFYNYDTLGRLTQERYAIYQNGVYNLALQKDYQYPHNTKQPSQVTTRSTYLNDSGVVNVGHSQVVQYTYDKLGRKLTYTNPAGATTTYTYHTNTNYLANQTTTFDTTTITDSYTYTNTGKLNTHTNANGFVTSHAYDVLDRRLSTTDKRGNQTTFAYDNMGRLLSQTSPLGTSQQTQYDLLGRKTKTINQNNHSNRYAYDALGNLTTHTDPSGFNNYYYYDSLNRLTATVDDNNRQATYEYNTLNKVISHTNAEDITTYFQIDPMGNQIKSRTEDNNTNQTITTSKQYDGLGRLTQITDGRGNATKFNYQSVYNQPSHIIDALGQTTQHSYTALGKLNTTTRPDGVRDVKVYDKIGRQTHQMNDYDNNATRRWTHYQYDGVGNLTRQQEAINAAGDSITTDKIYNAMNQLQSSTIDNLSVAFVYDEEGQLTHQTDPNGNTTNYTYDGLGNQLTITDAKDNTTTLSYDYNNQLTTTTDPLGNTTHRNYDN